MFGDAGLDRETLKDHYEYIIVGGGINGIGVFSELVKTGKDVLLIEAEEFMQQTSSRSSKMLHGGIRYLENFDFDLVYEALREKNYWIKECPELCKEQKFFIPVYQDSPNPLWKLVAGVKLYDALSVFQNSSSQFHSKHETLKCLPHLSGINLKGSVSYYDAIVDDYALGIFVLNAAKRMGQGQAVEYCQLKEVYKKNDFHLKVNYQAEEKSLTCHKLIFTTGPFTDQLMKNLELPWTPQLILSRGSHLFLKKDRFPIDKGVVIQEGNRVIFVIPHPDYILLGTTEHKEPDNIDLYSLEILPEEKQYLIDNFEKYFPDHKILDTDIIKTTTGIRPLVKDSRSTTPGKVSRHHEIYQMKENCYVLLGGKYTTFRSMAQDLVKKIG